MRLGYPYPPRNDHISNQIAISADPSRRVLAIILCKIQTGHKIKNPKSKIQNPKSKIQDPKSKIQMAAFNRLGLPQKEWILRQSKIQNPKSKIQDPKSKIQNPKSKIENPRSKWPRLTVWGCHKMNGYYDNPKSKIQNPRSKIQNPKQHSLLEKTCCLCAGDCG